MNLSLRPAAVPVLMLHSVAPRERLAPFGWLQDLSVDPDLVEASLHDWSRRHWRTFSLAELESALVGSKRPLERGLVLTLDDGYLDNWVVLSPLLRRFGHRATVFISTDFIDPTSGTRPRLDGVVDPRDVTWKGYLNWDEMRSLEAEGTIDIQSHARTHTWYFVSDRIVDYYRPENALTRHGSMFRFLWLNENRDKKPFALREMHDDSVAWGTPIYEFQPALVARRFYADPEETRLAVDAVGEGGGRAFFQSAGWRSRLDDMIRRYRSRGRSAVRQETREEYAARVRGELSESRKVLSEGLDKDVRYLAFPQGAFNDIVEDAARSCGYRLWTIASWRSRGLNVPGSASSRIHRCGTGYDLFGARASLRTRVASQGFVIRRYSGDPIARVVTGAASLLRRAVPRRFR